jgi:hypothetical protein
MKYYILNVLTEKYVPITFNSIERAKAFIKKHHFFGIITERKER